ncbi:MAG TPA: TRAP transporter substrate-binding protein [Kofleriaceae bacterium]|nr:TRAP transporter substrate-binding protein [Kofleriaceae bacterium]
MMRHFALALALLGFVALTPRTASADTYTLQIATVAPKKTPWAELLALYKTNVEKASNGRIKVKVFYGGTRGDENAAVRKVADGDLQGVGASTGAVASLVPELNAVEVPFLFRTHREADYVLDKKLLAPMEKLFRARGLVLGFWSENGYRHFGSSWGPVKKPDDIKNHRMRSQQSYVHIEMWKDLGANIKPIPTTEVVTALQKGTVEGWDQGLLFAIAAGWTNSVKHLTLSQHIYQPAVIAFNQAWFDKLPADLQKVLIDEGRKIVPTGRMAIRRIIPDLIKIVEKQGVTVHRLTDAERAVFEAKTNGIGKRFRKSEGKQAAQILDLIEAGLKEYRAGKR